MTDQDIGVPTGPVSNRESVKAAAATLMESGVQPSIVRILELLGGGSSSEVSRYLREWQAEQAGTSVASQVQDHGGVGRDGSEEEQAAVIDTATRMVSESLTGHHNVVLAALTMVTSEIEARAVRIRQELLASHEREKAQLVADHEATLRLNDQAHADEIGRLNRHIDELAALSDMTARSLEERNRTIEDLQRQLATAKENVIVKFEKLRNECAFWQKEAMDWKEKAEKSERERKAAINPNLFVEAPRYDQTS